MTIVVGVATPDGIIIAADSRMTMSIPDGLDHNGNGRVRYRIGSDTGEKVFEICGRYAVATYGDAFVGEQTIAGVMAEFEAQLTSPPEDVAQFADDMGAYFNTRYADVRDAAADPVKAGEEGAIGFLVAGYDTAGVGHVYDVLVPNGTRVAGSELLTSTQGIAPRGQTEVIWRLLNGVDFETADALGMQVPAPIRVMLGGLSYNILYPVTMQDAIDLSMFLIDTTINMQRFSDGVQAAPYGVQGCGGPVNMLAVQQSHVEWVQRTALKIRPSGSGTAAS